MSKHVRHIPLESSKGFHPFQSLRTDVEHIFEHLAAGFGRARDEQRRPPADASESVEGYHIAFELPGLDFDDIEVGVDGDVLYVYGEHRDEREEEDRNYYLAERRYGVVSRAVRLPEDADKERIRAQFAKGVLEFSIPRRPDADKDVRKIEIISP